MNKFILILGIGLALTACSKDPVSTNRTNNSEINVDLLFENDGCKIYRFVDRGYTHYYADCRPQHTASVDNVYNCGKGCVRHEIIPTVSQ